MIIVVSINTPTLPTSFIAIMISIIIIIQIDNNEDGDDEQTSNANQLAVQLFAAFYGVVAVGQHLKDSFSIQTHYLKDPHLNIYKRCSQRSNQFHHLKALRLEVLLLRSQRVEFDLVHHLLHVARARLDEVHQLQHELE